MEKCKYQLNRTIENSPYDNDVRYIDVEIRIYFGEEPLIINRDNYLVSFNMLEELTNDSEIYGYISSNEFDFELYNENDMFTITNENGPYYGKIDTNVKVEVKIREDISNSEFTTLGTYYVTDWICNQNSSIVSVSCNDKLYTILQSKEIKSDVYENISVSDFFKVIFSDLGLKENEYNISNLLNNSFIKYAYILPNEISNTLTELCVAHLLYLYVDRNDVICVKPVNELSSNIGTLTENNQILECNIEQSLSGTYSVVEVEHGNYEINTDTQLLSVNTTIATGLNSIKDDDKSEVIIDVDYITINSESDNVNLTDLNYDSSNIELILNNTSSNSSNVNINVIGSTLKNTITTKLTYEDKTLINRMGYKAKTVSSVFIDDVNKANEIKGILSKYISNTSPYVNVLIRGNPDIQLGSILTISSEVDKVNVEIMVTKQELSFNDSLECRLTGIDTSMLKGDI